MQQLVIIVSEILYTDLYFLVLTALFFRYLPVSFLTPRSFLFMILMATFSPVKMCRPSLTLAKPPGGKRKKENTHTGFRQDTIQIVTVFLNAFIYSCITGADSLINLIISLELVRSAMLRPFYWHLPCSGARW